MIPKIIHYCWFGRGKLTGLAVKCIESWYKYLPSYKFMLWNEDNFNIKINKYTLEAYNSKKYAFVTDYVRLLVLYNEGGIYMDTDVEVLKPLDVFLNLPAFSGFESSLLIQTGIIGSELNGLWVKKQLDSYNNKSFINPDGSFNTTTNVHIISDNMKVEGFIFNNKIQNHKDLVTIFPHDYFCPKSYDTGEIIVTENTYCIHHFAESWVPRSKKLKRKVAKIIGKKLTINLVQIKKRLFRTK